MGARLAHRVCAKIDETRNDMAIEADDGLRPEPGLGRALLTVLTMVVTTAVLFALIYLLMLGVAATSQGRPATDSSPSPVGGEPRAGQSQAQPATPSQPIAQPAVPSQPIAPQTK
jgi:hypothetical protein